MTGMLRVDAPKLRGSPCCVVLVDNGLVVGGAPYFRKFFGQPILHLVRWVKKFDGTVEVVNHDS